METITVSTDREGNVTLSKNGNATVKWNTDVQWNVTGPLLKSIAIRPYIQPGTGQIDIWQVAPAPYPDNDPPNVSVNWRGTVGNKDGSEYYYLDWIKKDQSSGTIDPKITVNR